MDISVTLFGGLRSYLPAGSSFNKCTLKLDEGGALSDLLKQLPIPADKNFIVIVNDERVPRETYTDLIIQADDQIVLLPPIKGG